MNRETRIIGEFAPAEVGINAAALNATTNGNAIPINGANQLKLDVEITNATGVALRVEGYLETKKFADTVWKPMVTKSVAAGVETLSARMLRYTTLPNPGTYAYSYETGIDGDQFRIRGVTDGAAGAGATDLVSISARISHSG